MIELVPGRRRHRRPGQLRYESACSGQIRAPLLQHLEKGASPAKSCFARMPLFSEHHFAQPAGSRSVLSCPEVQGRQLTIIHSDTLSDLRFRRGGRLHDAAKR